MQFRKADASDVTDHVYDNISAALKENKRVLWLVSGGSVIPIAVNVLNRLKESATHLQYLAVMQVDERFGPVGHVDSNWKQLQDAGFADENSTFLPILQGKDLQSTRSSYEHVLKKVLDEAVYKIGLFGIGPDGHTAGILPNTEGAHDDAALVVAYQGPDYTRITISPKVIARLDTVIAYAAGDAKEQTIRRLRDENIAPIEQPAQILKLVKDSYVYNDSLEGEI
jgi:6-phosphogluconolactonase/glucosamine-6-phosphate isomerase/deaminase